MLPLCLPLTILSLNAQWVRKMEMIGPVNLWVGCHTLSFVGEEIMSEKGWEAHQIKFLY